MFEDKRVLLIVNPTSGREEGGARRTALAEEIRLRGAADVEIRVTEGPDDALNWAAAAGAEGFQVVIAGGGDGTVTAVAHGVLRAGADLLIGIIPLGTGNGMARVLGLPLEPEATVRALATGKAVAVDVVEVPSHDTISLLFLGAGLDAEINRDADNAEKSRLGPLAYIKATLTNIGKARNHDVTLQLDGRSSRLRAHTVSVLNATRFDLMGLRLGPDAQPLDGKLRAVVLSANSFLGIVGKLLRLVDKRSSRAEMEDATAIVVEASPPLPVQVDGDVVGETPLEARILPAALRFIAAADSSVVARAG